MAFSIVNSRGGILTAVAEQNVNTTKTPISLHGRGKLEYGLPLNQNQVFMLENFARDIPPANAIQGQLWFEPSTTGSPPTPGKIYFYDFDVEGNGGIQPANPLLHWIELVSVSSFTSLGTSFLNRVGDTMHGDGTGVSTIGSTNGVLILETGAGVGIPGGTQYMFIGESQGNIVQAPDIRFLNSAFITSNEDIFFGIDADNNTSGNFKWVKGTNANPIITTSLMELNNTGELILRGDGTAGSIGRNSGVMKFSGFNSAKAITEDFLFFGEGQGDALLGPDIRGLDTLSISSSVDTTIIYDGTNALTGEFVIAKGNHLINGTNYTRVFSVSNAGTLFEEIDPTVYSAAVTADLTGRIIPNKQYVDNAVSTGLPAGAIIAFSTETVPTGFMECNGASISRTTFANLFAIIGTRYGNGDGSTTFTLPDYRGRFIRGWAHGSGSDPDRNTRSLHATGGVTGDNVGSFQGWGIQSHTHLSGGILGFGQGAPGFPNSVQQAAGFQPTTATGGNQTMPINVYSMYCIKF